MHRPEDTTFSAPRFLSFIELGYLLEAAKAADDLLMARTPSNLTEDSINKTGNLNATRQSLLRAVFIASYAVLEQSLDELMLIKKEKHNINLSPSDLSDRGIARSITYATKVLGYKINTNSPQLKDLKFIQDVRNHLVHYGPTFANTKEHNGRFEKFSRPQYVTLRPEICFTIEQIERIFSLYLKYIEEITKHDHEHA